MVEFLEEQHEQVKALLERVSSTNGEERKRSFDELVQLLEAHEAAEEQIVHPLARRKLDGGPVIIRAREEEEAQAKKALKHLATLDVDSFEFEEEFEELSRAVLRHAASEEQMEFQRLADILDYGKLVKMRKDAERVEAKQNHKPPEKRSH